MRASWAPRQWCRPWPNAVWPACVAVDAQLRRRRGTGRDRGWRRPHSAAANRDPDRFPGAEQLRVDREPAGHTAFGHGLHHCLGAQLARIEGQEAVGALLVARPGMALAVDPADLAYRHSTLIRGLRALPVRW